MNTAQHPAPRLREWRTFRGLTQTELATKAGMTQSAIARLESKGQVPINQTMVKLADALGCKPHQLYFAPEEREGEE